MGDNNKEKVGYFAGYVTSFLISIISTAAMMGIVLVFNKEFSNIVSSMSVSETVREVVKYISFGVVLATFLIIYLKTSLDVGKFVDMYNNNIQVDNNIKQQVNEQLNNNPARILGFDVVVGDTVELRKKNSSVMTKYVGYTVKNGLNHYKLVSNRGVVEVTNERLSNDGYSVIVHRNRI